MKKLEDIVPDDYGLESYSNIAAMLLLIHLVTSKPDVAKNTVEEITGMDGFKGAAASKSELCVNRGKLNSALRRASKVSYNLAQVVETDGQDKIQSLTGNIPVILKFFDKEQLYNSSGFKDFLYDCYLAVTGE